jgi:hypothetical protein
MGDFDAVIDGALKDPFEMTALLRVAKQAGLGKKAVASVIWQRAIGVVGGPEIPDPQLLLTFMQTHERSLKLVLGKQHLAALMDIYDGLQIVRRTPIPAGKPAPATTLEKFEDVTGTGISQASSRLFAVQSGRLGKNWMAVDWSARLFNRLSKRRQAALWEEALFDIDVARDLAKTRHNLYVPLPVKRRLNGYLFNMGFGRFDDKLGYDERKEIPPIPEF